jgi:ABC-type amino acid transport substrate-binding protein
MSYWGRGLALVLRLATFISLVASFSSLAAGNDESRSDLKSIKDSGVLRVAITHFDIPPFHMRRSDGTFVGKDIEFAQKLADTSR